MTTAFDGDAESAGAISVGTVKYDKVHNTALSTLSFSCDSNRATLS